MSEYWERIKTLDLKTVYYISEKLAKLESLHFEQSNELDSSDARAKDWAYRDVARILSETAEDIKQMRRVKRKRT